MKISPTNQRQDQALVLVPWVCAHARVRARSPAWLLVNHPQKTEFAGAKTGRREVSSVCPQLVIEKIKKNIFSRSKFSVDNTLAQAYSEIVSQEDCWFTSTEAFTMSKAEDEQFIP